jgi:tellurite methyltransferase
VIEKDIRSYFDNIYTANQNPYGETPSPLVVEIPKFLKKGIILDLGSGSGRSSLFLAQKGFDVEAVDISEVGLKILQAAALEKKLNIKTSLVDLNDFKIKGKYDVMICTFAIHNLSYKKALNLISQMQKHTSSGGLNLITAFTRESYFYKNHINQTGFYPPSKTELAQFYADWDIIKSVEERIKIRPTMDDGSPIFSTFAGILARKKA